VALRRCTVSFLSAIGVRHSVDVEAESLYEAAGLALSRLQKDGWVEGLGPGSRLEIEVREPGTTHTITVDRLKRWVNGTTSSPIETLRKAKVRQMLQLKAP
jgi:hypothetical protein